MASGIEFAKVVRNGVEFRRDPLVHSQTRINPARARRPKQGETDEWQKGLQETINKSAETCVFCPARIKDKVPKFAPEIGGAEGRIAQGETLVFPNLNPFGEGHAVGVLSNAHFVPIEGFSAAQVDDALAAAVLYLQAVVRHAAAQHWGTLVWNYMPPSAGSILHPHVQLMCEHEPLPELARVRHTAAQFYAQHKRSYWAALLEAEVSAKERLILSHGGVHALASFAPRGLHEVLLVLPGVSHLGQLSGQLRADLALVLTRILGAYGRVLGVGSFNLVSYSGPLVATTAEPQFDLHFKLIARPAPRALYTNDTGPLERMYDSWVVDSPPEQLAAALAPACHT